MNTYYIHKSRDNGSYGTCIMRANSIDEIPVGNNIPDDVVITIVEYNEAVTLNKPHRISRK